MKLVIALILGIGVGIAGFWFYTEHQKSSHRNPIAEQVEKTTTAVSDSIQSELGKLHLRADDIKDELARSGQVIRRKASEAGQAIADATADARITAAIKARLIASREVSGVGISVNTTAGVVTLSGSVGSPDEIGKAILLAMQSDGVKEVVSTLQVHQVAPAKK